MRKAIISTALAALTVIGVGEANTANADDTNLSMTAESGPPSLPDEERYTDSPGAIAYNHTDGWSYNFENDAMNPTPLEKAVGNEWLDAPGWPGGYTIHGPDCTHAGERGYCVFTGFPAHQGGDGFTVFLVWLSPGAQMPIDYIERVDATTVAAIGNGSLNVDEGAASDDPPPGVNWQYDYQMALDAWSIIPVGEDLCPEFAAELPAPEMVRLIHEVYPGLNEEAVMAALDSQCG